MKTMVSWLLSFFELFPRLDFAFYKVPKTFMFLDDRNYLQSLIFWAIIPMVLCLLLCVILLIIWSLSCCRRRSDSDGANNERPAKRRNEANRVACGFYAPIIILCMVAGVCLYANEWADRGMNSFVASLDDMKHSVNTRLGNYFDGLSVANGSVSNATSTINSLKENIRSRGAEKANDTVWKLLLLRLDELNFTVGNVSRMLSDMKVRFVGFQNTFDAWPDLIARIEFERWLLFVILYSTSFVVGVFGLIAICRRSRKGSIGYGVGGIFIFIDGWALAGAALFICLMLADACTDIKPYIESKLSPAPTKEMFKYYASCVTDSKSTENPISNYVESIEADAQLADKLCQDVSAYLTALFPTKGAEMQRQVNEVRRNFGAVIQGVNGLVQIIDCHQFRREYESAVTAVCYNALPGFTLALLFTIIFCLTLFGVLIAVSKAWRVFKKRLNDYVEVDSQDPFSIHRGTSHHSGSVLLSHDQSNIPADFYGTHVFNPRTRFASAAYNEEPEANGNAVATAPAWRNTPPPAYDSMHRAQQIQNHRRQQQTTTQRTLA